MTKATASPADGLLRLMALCGLVGPSWAAWRVVLRGFVGDGLTGADLDVWRRLTGRATGPHAPARELWAVCGRRSGKSITAAVVAVWLATCKAYRLAPGEVGTLLVVAADRKQARVVRNYIGGLLRAHRSLAALVASETAESVTLTSGIVLEVATCSAASVRGRTCIGVVCDEVAFWTTDGESPDADVEVLNALRPSLATTGGPLIALSSPHLRRGALYETHARHFAKDGDPVLVVQGPSRVWNPTIDASVIDDAMASDEPRARAEWLAEFRSDLEAYVSPAVVRACVVPGVPERPYVPGLHYVATVDVAGGSGSDSFACAVGHVETTPDGARRLVQDAVCEIRPPFSPEVATAEVGAVLRRFQVRHVLGDKFGGEWPRECFERVAGVSYVAASLTASEAYAEALPNLNAGRVVLVDHPRQVGQWCALERRASRTGRVVISHPPGKHDDLANVGALLIATAMGRGASALGTALTW